MIPSSLLQRDLDTHESMKKTLSLPALAVRSTATPSAIDQRFYVDQQLVVAKLYDSRGAEDVPTFNGYLNV